MQRLPLPHLVCTLAALATACTDFDRVSLPAGSVQQAILDDNRLSYNRLSYNRLSYNRLSYNRLSYNRLSYNSLEDGDLEQSRAGRDLLNYVARCAFPRGVSLVAEWDGHEYVFPGLLGLAPEWETRRLSASEEHIISACLISHVNAYGASLPISLRSAGWLDMDDEERQDYPVYEATFFGNVFGPELETYACVGDHPDLAFSLAPDRELRVCSDNTDCDVFSVGRCRDVCEIRTDEYGWSHCWAGDRRYDETISVFLHGAEHYSSCPEGGACVYRLRSDAGMVDCTEAAICVSSYARGSTYAVDNSHTLLSATAVKSPATVHVDCLGAEHCATSCQQGAECEIDCKDGDNCSAVCARGAACLLDCTGAQDCAFAFCGGEEMVCPGDIRVCNRPCPAPPNPLPECGNDQCEQGETCGSCPGDCGSCPLP
ncbi:MAG: hypothetical protein MJE77_15430 [Proteobacteria bacterium]|nr:hypothetical protein [Pseudomonadota bacterium]